MENSRETGLEFDPKFDEKGLLTAVVTDSQSGDVLVVAHMNAQAISLTKETGQVHFYSRSRQKLWLKGETSGNFLKLEAMRVDCDQDALWIVATPAGPICHTGAVSCFYRELTDKGLKKI
jgi:phosphoribosyl-AMP cyclohydrolase